MAKPLGNIDSQLKLGDRYQIIPFKGSVQYEVQTTNIGGFNSAVTVLDVESPRNRQKPIAEVGFAGVPVSHQPFFIWTERLGDIVPKVGDRFTDDESVVWHVKDATRELAGNRWRLMCTQKQV